jgi:hypothetical protein
LWQICKDKDEAEAWFVGLKSLISRWVMETKDGKVSDDSAKHIQEVFFLKEIPQGRPLKFKVPHLGFEPWAGASWPVAFATAL